MAGWYALDRTATAHLRRRQQPDHHGPTPAHPHHATSRFPPTSPTSSRCPSSGPGDLVLKFHADTEASRITDADAGIAALSFLAAVKNVTAIVSKGYHFDGWGLTTATAGVHRLPAPGRPNPARSRLRRRHGPLAAHGVHGALRSQRLHHQVRPGGGGQGSTPASRHSAWASRPPATPPPSTVTATRLHRLDD